jgi:DNA-binding XRE family transcriptional regulator
LRELSQKEAATRADVSQQFWSDVERGSSLPTIDLAHRMAAALGFAAHELWPPQTEGRRA